MNWINNYPVDNAITSSNTYPLDSDLSAGPSCSKTDQRLIQG